MAKKSKIKKKKQKSSRSTGTIDKLTVEKSPSNTFKMRSFYGWDGDILVLNILGTPMAKRDVIGKPKGNQLKISVTATPVAGRATDYMVAFLAKEFGVRSRDIEVVFGRMNINKQVRIKSPSKLPAAIERLERKK